MTIICEHTGNSLGIEEANSQYKQEQERKTPPTNCTFTYLLSLKREKDMSRGEIEATRKKRRQLNLYLH